MCVVYLIMMSEVTIGDGDSRGGRDHIDQPILAIGHGNMVNPNPRGSKHRDPISIATRPEPIVLHRIPNQSAIPSLDVMDM